MTLTRQEIFDKAYSGLEAQGFEKSLHADGEGCAYRGAGQRRCAVGFIIPDDRYNPEMEGIAADSLADKCLSGIVEITELDFVYKLQQQHDDAISPLDMQTRLRKFADDYALNAPAEASL